MRGFAVVFLIASAAWAAGPAAAAQDAFLMGAAYRSSDLRPLGPGVTTLTFVPGLGLVRSDAVAGPPAASDVMAPRAAALPTDRATLAFSRVLPATEAGGFGEFGVAAPIRLDRGARILQALGVGDGRLLGPEPRLFVFLAASGRALGYNFRQDDRRLALERGGFVGQAQAGIAYRSGDFQASLSYIRQEIDLPLFGVDDIDEDRGAVTLTRILGNPLSPSVRGLGHKAALGPPGELGARTGR